MKDSGLYDSGDVTFYQIATSEQRAVSARWTLTELATLPFQERAVGYAHFYAAQAARQDVDRAIRIDFYPEIVPEISTVSTVADISGQYYKILKITHAKNADALPVIDLDLTNNDGAIRRKLAE